MSTIVVDPLTRIEGHLKVEVTVDSGVITDAKCSGMLWRGIELIMKGRDPRDAVTITQRICGVCPTTHAMASTLSCDDAFGIAGDIPDNGRIIRNLIQGANYLQSHILHFYHLAALDYVDVTAVASSTDPALASVKDFITRALGAGDLAMLGPFVPRYEGGYSHAELAPWSSNKYALTLADHQNLVAHYVEALNMRRLAHEMSAIYSGIMPHQKAILPGGVTSVPTSENIAAFLWKLKQLQDFINNVYIPDVVKVALAYPEYFAIGTGCGNYLSYGVFEMESGQAKVTERNRFHKMGIADGLSLRELVPANITEDVQYSWYSSQSHLYPGDGATEPEYDKAGAYSWLKAPRYDGKVYEVGPLARMLISYLKGVPEVATEVSSTLTQLSTALGTAVGPTALLGVLGRHAARALEAKIVAAQMEQWLLQLEPGKPVYKEYSVPGKGSGMGLWEGPRGALGHWISIDGGKVKNYQAVVPTTWNCSPMDDQGQHGAVEQALIHTPINDINNPFEIGRIVRSFDPCIACAVHIMTPKGKELKRFRVV